MSILEMEVTDADLAAMFNMTTRWVRDRAADGTITRIGRNRYPLGDSVQALIAYQTGGDVGEEINKARLRKLNADATRAELALAKERGEVALICEFEQAWSNRYTIIKQTMLNIPGRAVLQLIGETNERRFKDVLREEIVLGLTHAANAEINTSDEEETEDEQDD
ncbi:hypothetical protein ACNRBS_20855 [Ralstonia pseudosolanacearum]|uniref:hypothetical protein n=1 Tax=Ralstonia pseudosolanacearum TaxID=1310165 RepID=UPI003AAF8546